MGFWIFMLFSSEMVPALMLLFGWIFRKHPPKNINNIYGYRTSMSMKNTDTWNFAHSCCGRLWWKIGKIMFAGTIAVMLPLINKDTETTGLYSSVIMMVQCAILLGSIYPVERALRKNFDKTGKRI